MYIQTRPQSAVRAEWTLRSEAQSFFLGNTLPSSGGQRRQSKRDLRAQSSGGQSVAKKKRLVKTDFDVKRSFRTEFKKDIKRNLSAVQECRMAERCYNVFQ